MHTHTYIYIHIYIYLSLSVSCVCVLTVFCISLLLYYAYYVDSHFALFQDGTFRRAFIGSKSVRRMMPDWAGRAAAFGIPGCPGKERGISTSIVHWIPRRPTPGTGSVMIRGRIWQGQEGQRRDLGEFLANYWAMCTWAL